MGKKRLTVLAIIATGMVLGWSLAAALRDYPTLRVTWLVGLGVLLLMLWHFRERYSR